MKVCRAIVPVVLVLAGLSAPARATSGPPVDAGTGDLTIAFHLGQSPEAPVPPPVNGAAASAAPAAGAAGGAAPAAGAAGGPAPAVAGAQRPRFTFEAQPHPLLDQVFFYVRSVDRLEGPFAVAIRDGQGRDVRRLDGVMARGSALLVWDGCATGGEKAGPGAYFAKLETDGEAFSRNVIVR